MIIDGIDNRAQSTDRGPKAFHTYSSYVQGWADLIDGSECLVERAPSRILPESGLAEVGRSLARGWSNLHALHILGDDGLPSDVLPIHPPVAWYGVHHIARAMVLGRGNTPPASHGGLLNALARESEHAHFPSPWSAYCEGDPAEKRFGGGGKDWTYSHSNLSPFGAARPEAWAAMSLKTTRDKLYEARLANWRKGNKRSRIPAPDKTRIALELRPTTVFDVLYRFRHESQYGNMDHFESHSAGEDADRFARSLLRVADGTAIQLEQKLIDEIGSDKYLEFLDAYAARHGLDASANPLLSSRAFVSS